MKELVTTELLIKAGLPNPRFTPLEGRAAEVFDPSFLPGLGVLSSDPVRGLRCPFRGCGAWRHHLSTHVRVGHAKAGGIETMRSLLGFSRRVGFVSETLSQTYTGRINAVRPAERPMPRARHHGPRNTRTIDVLNTRNSCPAQIRDECLAFRNEYGRFPSLREFIERNPRVTDGMIRAAYGTWTHALALAGVSTRTIKGHVGVEECVESLRNWVAVHGELPTNREIRKTKKAPRMFDHATYRRVFAVGTWHAAMEYAAAILDIYQPHRFGLPQRNRERVA